MDSSDFPKIVMQCCARCVITAHAVNAAARRCGSRTQINSINRRAVRRRTENWSGNQLCQIRCTAVDVAAGQIRIRSLKISGTHLVAGENAIAKTGRESLDLRFDLIRHIRAAVEWNMAVSPERVLTSGARVSSNKLCCATSTNGRSGIFPRDNLAFRRRNFIDACRRDELCLRDGKLPLSTESAHLAHNRF